jgi:hypothetical protein
MSVEFRTEVTDASLFAEIEQSLVAKVGADARPFALRAILLLVTSPR